MHHFRNILVPAALAILFVSGVCSASDMAKEKRWAEQIVEGLIDGEPVYLNDGRNDFLTIVTESSVADSPLAAVVMHGSGVHPDWPTVVQPIRVGLAERGWHTISIQMPVLANDAGYDDYTEVFPEVPGRIDAAIKYLKTEMGARTIVLIAHSLGAAMTTYYLASDNRAVDGFIAVGLGSGGNDPVRDTIAQLRRIRLPMLDLYGSEDLPGVVRSAPARRAAQAGNPAYSQRMEPGADHFFEGEEDALVDHIDGWLARFAGR